MRKRRELGEHYLVRAEMGRQTDPAERTVNVGIATIAGIAFADAICLGALGQFSTSGNHSDAVELLRTVDKDAAKHLQTLVSQKTATQYGVTTVSTEAAVRAMRAVNALAEQARLL